MLYVEFAVGEGHFATFGLNVGEGFQDVSHGLVAQAEVVQLGERAFRFAVRVKQSATIGGDTAFRSEIGATFRSLERDIQKPECGFRGMAISVPN